MSAFSKQDILYEAWPPLSYPDFAATQHLLHMGLQAVGKLKLKEPFEPQWAKVPLWLSSRGLTTGPIHYSGGAYEVTVDLISHHSWLHDQLGIFGVLRLGVYVCRRIREATLCPPGQSRNPCFYQLEATGSPQFDPI